MQISLFGGSATPSPAKGGRSCVPPRSQRTEHGVKTFDRRIRAANHQAIPAFQAPDSAARPYVDVVNPLGSQFLVPSYIVDVVGIPPIDSDVLFAEPRRKVGESAIHGGGGHHQPHRPWSRELGHKIIHRNASHSAFGHERLHRCRASVVNDTLVPAPEQTADHVCSHSS